MERLVIAAPFGNWLQWPHATSTLGSFTREFRGGAWRRLWRVLRTVRYYPGIKAWRNRLGLPNPGIDWLASRCGTGGQVNAAAKIVAIAARDTADWNYLLGSCFYLVRPGWVELNVSCPNCPGEPDRSAYALVFREAARLFPGQVIVKLPPVGYLPIVQQAFACGIANFHCCNTLPTPGGGLSGKPLKPLSLQAVADVRQAIEAGGHKFQHLIGGGGVTNIQDARDYLGRGATSVAVASVLFLPWRWPALRKMAQDLAAEYPRAC